LAVSIARAKSLEYIASIFSFFRRRASFFAWSSPFFESFPGMWPCSMPFSFSTVLPCLVSISRIKHTKASAIILAPDLSAAPIPSLRTDNPYLAFAVMLRAGLEGIKNKYPLPEPIEEDVYEMTTERRKELNIGALPGSLYEAIEQVESSKLIRDTLGEHVFEKLVENKKIEWDRFRTHVSQYEVETYLPIL